MKNYILGFFIIFAAILSAHSASAAEPFTYQYNRVLEHGSGGNDVVMARFCLAEINHSDYDIDGYFNSRTKMLVTEFQKANGLYVDGVIGPMTGLALELACNGEYANTTSSTSSQKIVSDKVIAETYENISASVRFSFDLKNTSTSDISFTGLDAFVLEVNGTAMNAQTLNKTDGYTVLIMDDAGNVFSETSGYIFEPQSKASFDVLVGIDTRRTKKGSGTYWVSLERLDYTLAKRDKNLVFTDDYRTGKLSLQG